LLGAIQTACKIISRAVHRAGVDDLRGDVHGGTVENSTGDIVKRLDVLSNDTMIHFLVSSGQLCVAASEETDYLIVPPPELTGEFCVTFDPLDGSSNIDAGVNVGTIFGIYRRISDSGPTGHNPGNLNDILQPPRKLISAGYTMLVSPQVVLFLLLFDKIFSCAGMVPARC
jgi:fructose-1,6-bisphosphatase I